MLSAPGLTRIATTLCYVWCDKNMLTMAHCSDFSCVNKQGRTLGFTLLELLLVIFLLSSLALVTTLFVDNANEQFRFETTKTRLEQIRHAIIGDTSRTLNGQPVISGFVADMGRLPENIHELIEPPSDADQLWGITEIDLSGVVIGTLYGGWRGSYLDAMQESGVSGVRAFRDGWGNPDVAGSEANFGWKVDLLPEGAGPYDGLSIQSFGSDGPDGVGTESYQVNYPSDGYKVSLNDWATNIEGQSFNVVLNGVASNSFNDLKLRFYYLINGQLNSFDSNAFEISSVSGVLTPPVFPTGKQLLPTGTHAAVIVCNDGTVYNGNCPGSPLPPYYFKLIPRAYAPPMTVEWTIP